jgi:predicted RNase H-like HicB family nuclease
MTHTIALIHKDAASSYGVSFPDLPGVTTAADSLDDAIERAAEALAFAAEDWSELTGSAFPEPRALDDLRRDDEFRDGSRDAVVAAIPLDGNRSRPAAA